MVESTQAGRGKFEWHASAIDGMLRADENFHVNRDSAPDKSASVDGCLLSDEEVSLAPEDFFQLATTTNLRGHPLKLRVTGARLDTRKFFFSKRAVDAWNALPLDVVMAFLLAQTLRICLTHENLVTNNIMYSCYS
ncbi:unnamed protein product [Schistocephalus solidus]|uniref:CIA30 domain-containing protein n=1 Tax=Schistocephalus solidus TaxID=70667 RepID=A0A183T1N5_SCHSO|nr:unnamed protein product [Schistocephalus solidus]